MIQTTTSHSTTQRGSKRRAMVRFPIALLATGVVATGVLTGCGDSGPTEPLPDTQPVLEWVLEAGPYHDLVALSGAGIDAAVAVGRNGAVLRWDGATWSEVPAVPGSQDRGAVWSANPDTFFVADYWADAIRRCDASGCTTWEDPPGLSSIRDLWGISTDNVFAVGQGGDVLHFDGQGWSAMAASVPGRLSAVWGAGPDDIFAAGWGGIARYDGTAWSTVALPASASELHFADIWGSGPTDVYAVGNEGGVLHFDGTGWSRVDAGTAASLTGVWGTGPTDVFVAGLEGNGPDTRGTVLHFDGTGWSPLPIPDGLGGLAGLWGSGPDDAWAVGDEGTILHWDGTTWSSVRGGMGRELEGVAGSSDANIFAVGRYTLLHDDGAGWTRMMTESESWTTHTDVAFVGPDVYITGSGGYFSLLRVRGGIAQSVDSAPLGGWHAVWGAEPDTVVVVGHYGQSAYFDGSDWTTLETGFITTVTDVWGASGTNIWAVAGPEMYRYAGVGWAKVDLGESVWLTGIWGAAADHIFAVGLDGAILHWDGETWTPMESGTTADLMAVRGSSPENVYAVGHEGTVVHYDGTGWAPVELPFFLRAPLLDVWLEAGTDVIAVGAGGTIVRGRR